MDSAQIPQKLKEQIMASDYEMLILLKRRLQSCRKLAQHCKKNDLDPFTYHNYNEMLRESQSKAAPMALKKTFTDPIFSRIIETSDKEIKEEMES